jgi:hypothetical protein
MKGTIYGNRVQREYASETRLGTTEVMGPNSKGYLKKKPVNPINAELNPICHLLALLEAHHILHVSRIEVKANYTEVYSSENRFKFLNNFTGLEFEGTV